MSVGGSDACPSGRGVATAVVFFSESFGASATFASAGLSDLVSTPCPKSDKSSAKSPRSPASADLSCETVAPCDGVSNIPIAPVFDAL